MRITLCVCVLTLASSIARAQVSEPRPLAGNPRPKYPQAGIADGVIGFADVEIKVKADGSAESVRVVNAGPPGFGFENAAKSAATGWRFAPTPGSAGAGKYLARFNFGPTIPVPIANWQRPAKAKASVVEPGHVLRLSGGWVHTRRWFSDFTLDLEYRLLEAHTVAAVVFHAQFIGQRGDYTGYEVLLTDQSDGRSAFGRVDSRGGLKYREVSFDESLASASPKAVGEWHKLRVESANGGAQVLLNGALLSKSDQFLKTTGHIGLEVKRGAMEVRLAQIVRRDTFYSYRAEPGNGALSQTSPGVTAPKLTVEIKPDYSVEATRQLREGIVELSAVVLPDGSPDRITITKSLDLDLDQAAVAALRHWKFAPGRTDTGPVPVLVYIEFTFTLR
jgi:TonB family protein